LMPDADREAVLTVLLDGGIPDSAVAEVIR
jgi:hypothetical protein